MPYFKTNEINIYYIHVPKTGGMSIEKYFYEKFGIEKSHKNGYGYNYPNVNFELLFGNKHTLQHIPYLTIIERGRDLFNLDLNNIVFLATVRNPYHRIVSDLFFFVQYTGININSTKEDVETSIFNYLNDTTWNYDNHRMPQYQLLVDSECNIPKNMVILKMENLTEEMHGIGFSDFNFTENTNRTGVKINYMSLLTDRSIELINNYYYEDFERFGYIRL
jgi:hypothetical protein